MGNEVSPPIPIGHIHTCLLCLVCVRPQKENMSFHCTNSCSVPNTLCTITSHSISIPSLKLKCNTNNNRFKIHAKSNSDDAPQQPTSTPSSFLSFLCPLLNLFSVTNSLFLKCNFHQIN